ncbi:MAG: DUF3429 domain-containing protein [Pseudomonadota bacterium]
MSQSAGSGLRPGAMEGVPSGAKWLGLAGLLPFAAAALGAVALAPEAGGTHAEQALLAYGALILSFMGGCRWGFAAAGMGDEDCARQATLRYAVSVLPALYAWPLLALPAGADGGVSGMRLGLLALGFLALLAADLALVRAQGAPAWWPALRWPLSLGAAGALLVAALFG